METLLLKIIEISISASFLIVLVAILSQFFRKVFTARWKVFVWLIIALRLLLPFSFEFKQPIVEIKAPEIEVAMLESGTIELMPASEKPIVTAHSTQNTNSESIISKEPSKQSNFTLIQVAAFIWLLGMIVYIGFQLLLYINLMMKLHRWAIPAATEVQQIAAEESYKSGIKCKVSVLQSVNISVPMMIGFIKPTIILPVREYKENELHFICCHECVHYRNKDIWIKLIAMFAAAIHWFNPFVHIMNYILAQDLEIACDSAVVKNKDIEYRKAYNYTILNTLDKNSHSFPLTTAFSNKHNLKQRFIHNLDMKLKNKGRLSLCIVVVICIAAGGLVACNKISDEPVVKNEHLAPTIEDEVEIPYDQLPFGFNEKEYEPIDLDEFKTIIQNNDYEDNNIIIRRIDEEITFKGYNNGWLLSLQHLNLTNEDHQIQNILPKPVTITVTLDDKSIKFDFTDEKGVKVNNEILYIENTDALQEMLENDYDEILTADHFKLQEVLPFEIKDIESIDITKTHYQQSITANLQNAESINHYMKYVMNKYVRERTDEMRYIGLAGGPRVKAVINLKDGSQVTYVPDGYVTLTINDKEYKYDYAFDLTDLTLSGIITQDFETPYSSDLHGLTGPEYTINDILMNNHIFSYKVGNDHMHDEYRGFESITPETTAYFKEERLLADIYIDSGLKLYVRRSDETALTEIPTSVIESMPIPHVPGYEKFMNKGFMKHYQAELPHDIGQYYVEMVLDWGDGDTISLASSYMVSNLPERLASIAFVNEADCVIESQGELYIMNAYKFDIIQKLNELYLSADSERMKSYTLDTEFKISFTCEGYEDTIISFTNDGILINDVKTSPSQELIISINDFLPVENE